MKQIVSGFKKEIVKIKKQTNKMKATVYLNNKYVGNCQINVRCIFLGKSPDPFK